ncbi:hypothetical protein J6590_104577 [Homalodisca vitripennis]|nr:hypothetical protein J6590_104577 [Homalodisca vitripennis]
MYSEWGTGQDKPTPGLPTVQRPSCKSLLKCQPDLRRSSFSQTLKKDSFPERMRLMYTDDGYKPKHVTTSAEPGQQLLGSDPSLLIANCPLSHWPSDSSLHPIELPSIFNLKEMTLRAALCSARRFSCISIIVNGWGVPSLHGGCRSFTPDQSAANG